jgi:hypothetical protein
MQDYLDNAGEKFVSATKSFSAQTSARALLGFFEEKLEKLRKNLLGPPSGKVLNPWSLQNSLLDKRNTVL